MAVTLPYQLVQREFTIIFCRSDYKGLWRCIGIVNYTHISINQPSVVLDILTTNLFV